MIITMTENATSTYFRGEITAKKKCIELCIKLRSFLLLFNKIIRFSSSKLTLGDATKIEFKA